MHMLGILFQFAVCSFRISTPVNLDPKHTPGKHYEFPIFASSCQCPFRHGCVSKDTTYISILIILEAHPSILRPMHLREFSMQNESIKCKHRQLLTPAPLIHVLKLIDTHYIGLNVLPKGKIESKHFLGLYSALKQPHLLGLCMSTAGIKGRLTESEHRIESHTIVALQQPVHGHGPHLQWDHASTNRPVPVVVHGNLCRQLEHMLQRILY